MDVAVDNGDDDEDDGREPDPAEEGVGELLPTEDRKQDLQMAVAVDSGGEARSASGAA